MRGVRKRVAIFVTVIGSLCVLSIPLLPTMDQIITSNLYTCPCTLQKRDMLLINHTINTIIATINQIKTNLPKRIDSRHITPAKITHSQQNDDTHSMQYHELKFPTKSALTEKQKLIKELSSALRIKLDKASTTPNKTISFKSCKEHNITNYDDSCKNNGPCLKQSISDDLDTRIESLVFPPNMRVPDRYRDIIQDLRNDVKGNYDLIILHAMSSNHFRESQAMLKNFHQVVFPVVKNSSLIVYDLGLTDAEREQYKKHCRCTLLRFPFEKLPDHFANLKSFAWKVFIIAAHFEQAEVTMWTDSSISITNATGLLKAIKATRVRGVQQRCNNHVPNPLRTLPQMFEAFGDSPCAHLSFQQCEGGYGLYHREPLIRHAVIGAWVTCVSNPFCIMPVNQRPVQACEKTVPGTIGQCMRTDQSAISLILAKLFREKMDHFAMRTHAWSHVNQTQKLDYFNEIEKKGKS